MKIHSVRLPGYVASQEVIFGGQGETLKSAPTRLTANATCRALRLAAAKLLIK